MNTRLFTAFLAMACFVGTAAVHAQNASADDPYKAIATWTINDSRKTAASIEAEIRKAPVAQYKAIEAKLIGVLKSPDATPDSKNFICRMLSVVGSANCVPAVAPLIADEKTSHMARFALEAIQDPAAAAALRKALGQVRGKLLVGVISSIGARQDAQAVQALSDLTTNDDQAVALAAIRALGTIGTTDAAQALAAAKVKVADTLREAVSTAQIDAAQQLAAARNTDQAVAIYRSLVNDPSKAIRIGATRGLLGALDKAQAVKLALQTLQGNDMALRSAALAAIQTPSEKNLRDALAEALPSLPADAQLAVLAVLADQPDVTLRPALLNILNNSGNEQVRAAAMRGMAMYGQAADVPMLVNFAARNSGADAAAARQTLERMGRSGVDEALVQMLASANAANRSVIISVLASRRTEAAVNALVRLMGSSDPAAATDAVKGLEVLGTPAQLPQLAAIIASTDNPALRKAAESTAGAICTRTTDKEACSKAILPVLSQAKTTPGRSALLRLLPRIRDDKSLAAVRRFINDPNTEVSEVATRTLIDWPEFAAVPYLLDLAKQTDNPTHAVLALRGCIRLAGAAKDQPTEQRLRVYRSVLDIAKRPEEKRQALAGLGDLPALGALELVQKSLKDPALGSDAASAGIRLARQLATSYNKEAMALLKDIQGVVTSDALRRQLEEAMKAVAAGGINDGYIVAWTLAGPYTQDNKDGGALFNVAFAPERRGRVDWRPIAAGGNNIPGFVELNRILGGDNRVAYLRTQITSSKDQEAILELGSDDGVKVWLNGKLVHATNATRPFSQGQDKVKINLKKGDNTLLLKITQGGGEWSACARLRSVAGGNLDDISVSAPLD